MTTTIEKVCVRCTRHNEEGAEAVIETTDPPVHVWVCRACIPLPPPQVLVFLGIKGQLEDGIQASATRCPCLDRANLRAVIRAGQVVDAGCPVCRQQWPCELSQGRVDFFPPGVTVIGL